MKLGDGGIWDSLHYYVYFHYMFGTAFINDKNKATFYKCYVFFYNLILLFLLNIIIFPLLIYLLLVISFMCSSLLNDL